MQDYKKLKVWQRADALDDAVYSLTLKLPNEEKFGLISQMRRSARSISASIVEGCGRSSRREFAYYLEIAVGSANELERDLDKVQKRGWAVTGPLVQELIEIRMMLCGLIRRVSGN
jgi:four helix bundle protein